MKTKAYNKSIVWKRDYGLVYYTSGFGTERDLIKLSKTMKSY